MIRIFVSRLVLPDKLWSIGLFIEFVDDEGLRRPVAWTFCSTADASVAFRLPFVTPDFPLRASAFSVCFPEIGGWPSSRTFLHSKHPGDRFGIVKPRAGSGFTGNCAQRRGDSEVLARLLAI